MTYGQQTNRHAITLKPGQRILACDPGGTTGLIQVQYTHGRDFNVICCTELPWKDRFLVRNYLQLMDWIVIERFTPYAHKAQALTNNTLPAVQMIGIIEAYAHDAGFLVDRHIIYQGANMTANVQILPEHAALVGRGSEHRKDSYKHARVFIVTNSMHTA